MKIDSIDVDSAINHAKQLLDTERDITPALKSALEGGLLLVTVLLNRVTLNSNNSSKPPASDPNRKKGNRKKSDNPDEVKVITIDRRTLPKGQYTYDGFETRQVFDIDISRVVTEYQAQRLINEKGQRFIAPFPDEGLKWHEPIKPLPRQFQKPV